MTPAAVRPQTAAPVLVFDIGGTKIAGGVSVGGAIHCRTEVATGAADGPDAVLGRIVSLGRKVLTAFACAFPAAGEPAVAGVATAGQVDPTTGTLVFATDSLPGWIGLALGPQLAAALGLPVFVDNDVNCFALAEAMVGAGRGYRHLLLVAVGTGIGGGLVVDGQLYRGRRGGAGEIGQILVVPDGGRPCSGALTGCLEAYAATSVMVARSGYPSIQALAAEYLSGVSVPAVDEAAGWLGYGLASAAHMLAPEAILVGGSVGLLGESYLAQVRAAFWQHTLASHRDIPLLPTALGADSGLIGAGLLAME
jgi:glucokinase